MLLIHSSSFAISVSSSQGFTSNKMEDLETSAGFWLSLTHTGQGVLLLASWLLHFPVKEKISRISQSGLFLSLKLVGCNKDWLCQKKGNPSRAQPKDGDLILFIM